MITCDNNDVYLKGTGKEVFDDFTCICASMIDEIGIAKTMLLFADAINGYEVKEAQNGTQQSTD